jgi:beta-glucanase (GH16 family)
MSRRPRPRRSLAPAPRPRASGLAAAILVAIAATLISSPSSSDAAGRRGIKATKLELKVRGSSVVARFGLSTKRRRRFKRIVVAVRDAEGQNLDFAHRSRVRASRRACRSRRLRSNCPSPTKRRFRTRLLVGGRSLAPGRYRAWVAYQLKGRRWFNSTPVKRFRVGVDAAVETSPEADRPPPTQSATLAFSDEFDDGAVDPERWAFRYPRSGDMIYSNWNNGEAQWYKPANVSESDGALNLTAKRETTVSPYSGRTFHYSSGMIQSKPSLNFRYGYMEARMRLPRGSGLWPAFWTWASNEQWPPEIDVMEFFGDNVTTTYHTYHYPGGNTGGKAFSADWSADWHTFAVDWRPDGLSWYVDGNLVKQTASAPRLDMYLIFNLAVSNGAKAPPPDGTTRFPATLSVDYVRVWKR